MAEAIPVALSIMTFFPKRKTSSFRTSRYGHSSEIQAALKYDIKGNGFDTALLKLAGRQALARTASSHHHASFLPSSQSTLTSQSDPGRCMEGRH